MPASGSLEAPSSALGDPIEYRKSGLSLNHIIGCPLDCAYCVRHLFDNFEMKMPTASCDDETAVNLLVSNRYFVPHTTPLQVFNRATDPLLPSVKPHLFRVIELLDEAGYRNHLLVISRYRFLPEDAERLNRVRNLRVTLLVTYSGIADKRIEPIDSNIAAESLRLAYSLAQNYRVILYWRPLVPGLNDSPEHLSRIHELSRYCHAVVFTGLFYRDAIRSYFVSNGLPDLYEATARRKIFPENLEATVIESFRSSGLLGKLFRKTSCGVSFAHGLPDYNGHYCIRELCDICPVEQVRRCADSHSLPSQEVVNALAEQMGASETPAITDRGIQVSGLDEQRRYFIQHRLNFQVHDTKYPHKPKRHGRAEIGWLDKTTT